MVKKIKLETSFGKSCDVNGLFWWTFKVSQVALVEKQLEIESSATRFGSITPSELKSAAEMFIYLNTCTDSTTTDGTHLILGKWFKSWFRLYNDLFKLQTTDQIILTLNRLMKKLTPKHKVRATQYLVLFMRASPSIAYLLCLGGL